MKMHTQVEETEAAMLHRNTGSGVLITVISFYDRRAWLRAAAWSWSCITVSTGPWAVCSVQWASG